MKKLPFLLLLLFIFCNSVSAQSTYQKDFDEFWKDINDNYAYLNEQKIDWRKVKEIYDPQVKKVNTRNEFIQFLENVLMELYNGHSSLNSNLNSSNRLIPSGQDMYVTKTNTKFFVSDLRKGLGAELSGLKVGMEITSFNGKKIEQQLLKFLPKFTKNHTEEMYQYAIDMLFAGTHDTKREITANVNGKPQTFFPDNYKVIQPTVLAESKVLNSNTAYIKINNSLGNNDLIALFDKELDGFLSHKNLVIDLTDTPGGGNTTVARAILGRFTKEALPYQKHELDEKEFETKRVWIEYVLPRKKQFTGNVYVLVGHWTGSMGEGIAIGFDGMKKGTIIGTKMAGLIGAISNFQMSETKIGFQFPTERLYHINGTPRESYLPTELTKNTKETYKRMNEIK